MRAAILGSAHEQNLTVPPTLRHQAVRAWKVVEQVSTWRGPAVSWSKPETTVAVTLAGAEQADQNKLPADVASPDDEIREYEAWRAGWAGDAMGMPVLPEATHRHAT